MDQIIQIAQVGLLRIFGFDRVHVDLSTFIDQAMDIAEPDIFTLHPKFQQHIQTSDARRPATGRNNLDVLEFLVGNEKRVFDCRTDHDRRAVLIVMKHWYVHAFAADTFDGKAIGGFDVLKVDGTEGGFQCTYQFSKLFGVMFVKFDIEAIDVGELFK